jgi:phosphoadenosine phosphosulfate reductase
MVEPCNRGGRTSGKWYLNAIIDWTKAEVWEYIRTYNVPYCKLYDEGWNRIGCVGCPCSYYKRRNKELNDYPRIRRAYQRAFHDLYEKNKDNPAYARWRNGEEMFLWWLQDESVDNDGTPPLFT